MRLPCKKNDSSDVAAVALWKNMQREFVAIVESFLRGRELMRRCPVHEVVAVFQKEWPFALSGQYSGTILDPRQQLASIHPFNDFLAIVMGYQCIVDTARIVPSVEATIHLRP